MVLRVCWQPGLDQGVRGPLRRAPRVLSGVAEKALGQHYSGPMARYPRAIDIQVWWKK